MSERHGGPAVDTCWILTYHVVPDFVERRGPYRAEHLQRARDAGNRGELLLGGALDEPADGAVIVFRAKDRSVAEDFARRDPYVRNGLVERWEVRKWNVVIGSAYAEHPSR